MDIVSLLPRTQRGNRYILTAVDHFTKHVDMYALPDQEAVTIARVVLNKFNSRLVSRTSSIRIKVQTSSRPCLQRCFNY